MKPLRKFLLLAAALLGSLSAAGCVYYPARPYYGNATYREYHPDGYTPYYTDYYVRPYIGAVWIGGGRYHGHWVRGHWR
jgi:hypothetical protein